MELDDLDEDLAAEKAAGAVIHQLTVVSIREVGERELVKLPDGKQVDKATGELYDAQGNPLGDELAEEITESTRFLPDVIQTDDDAHQILAAIRRREIAAAGHEAFKKLAVQESDQLIKRERTRARFIEWKYRGPLLAFARQKLAGQKKLKSVTLPGAGKLCLSDTSPKFAINEGWEKEACEILEEWGVPEAVKVEKSPLIRSIPKPIHAALCEKYPTIFQMAGGGEEFKVDVGVAKIKAETSIGPAEPESIGQEADGIGQEAEGRGQNDDCHMPHAICPTPSDDDLEGAE